MTDDDSTNILIKVAGSFADLKSAAADLNAASDGLGKAISSLDASLQRLNLGISAWVRVNEWGDRTDYILHQLGYDRVGPRWGIALRATEGNEAHDEVTRCDEWLFNDAPRDMRVAAVEKLPELLEKLTHNAKLTAERIRNKTEYAEQVASGIALPPPPPRLPASLAGTPPPGSRSAVGAPPPEHPTVSRAKPPVRPVHGMPPPPPPGYDPRGKK